MIYQPSQDRVILFGGFDVANRNDVWALWLSGPPKWTKITPAGTPPPAGYGHVAVYDAARDRMIAFGGALNGVWELTLGSTPTWTRLSPGGTPPGPLSNSAGVYDSAHDQFVVFGGFDFVTQTFKNDVWALSLAGGGAWSQLLPSGTPPSARRSHSMIFDAARGRMVVFGGSLFGWYNDVYTLTLDPSPSWAQLTPAGPHPSERLGHGAVYDAARDRMWIFGGEDGEALRDTWWLSLDAPNAWQQHGGSPLPRPRRNYGVTIAGGSIVLFGGDASHGPDNGSGPSNETWKLGLNSNPPAWDPGLPQTISPRDGHHLIYDPPRNRILTFGGYDGQVQQLRNDVNEFPLATGSWQPVATSGTPPSEREYYGLVYDPVRQRMVVIGGYRYFLNDVWALELNGPPVWNQLAPAGVPPSPRYGHSLIYQPGQDRVILFGGYDGASSGGYKNDVWALSLAGAPTWTQLVPPCRPPDPCAGSSPAGRMASAVIYDGMRNRMIVFGGQGEFRPSGDVWALSLGANPVWTRLAPTGVPPEPRAYIDGVYDPVGDRLIMMAGFNSDVQRFYAEAWQLAFGSSPTPALVSLVSARAEPGRARIEWQVAGRAGGTITVWRRDDAAEWSAVGERVPDGEGRVAFEDRMVAAGARYEYRIGFREGGRDVYAGEVSLDIPRAVRLSLSGARPNPAGRVLTIGYALEDASPATLELFDTSGRRVLAREVGSEGAGTHEFGVADADSWPAGIYFARLRQHGRALTSRVAIVR